MRVTKNEIVDALSWMIATINFEERFVPHGPEFDKAVIIRDKLRACDTRVLALGVEDCVVLSASLMTVVGHLPDPESEEIVQNALLELQ